MNSNPSEPNPHFPSGQWEGFYTYYMGPDAARHSMSFHLDFQNGLVTGAGGDDVGAFNWRGEYDTVNLRCAMTKYYATHTVLYEGDCDENGIWGTWTIGGGRFRGGFHIWPKGAVEKEEERVVTEEPIKETGKPKN